MYNAGASGNFLAWLLMYQSLTKHQQKMLPTTSRTNEFGTNYWRLQSLTRWDIATWHPEEANYRTIFKQLKGKSVVWIEGPEYQTIWDILNLIKKHTIKITDKDVVFKLGPRYTQERVGDPRWLDWNVEKVENFCRYGHHEYNDVVHLEEHRGRAVLRRLHQQGTRIHFLNYKRFFVEQHPREIQELVDFFEYDIRTDGLADIVRIYHEHNVELLTRLLVHYFNNTNTQDTTN